MGGSSGFPDLRKVVVVGHRIRVAFVEDEDGCVRGFGEGSLRGIL